MMAPFPIKKCPFCQQYLTLERANAKKIFVWSDCDNESCDSGFMQYHCKNRDRVLLWKFNIEMLQCNVKIDFHFSMNQESQGSIICYKKDSKGITKLLFEIDSSFEPDFSNLDKLREKMQNLFMFY